VTIASDPERRWLDPASPDASSAPTILEPVRMRSAGEHIADRVVTAIALGEFVPGQRLPTERDLASMLSVSRTTVREAIQRLAALGYVEVRRGRNGGAYVQKGWGPDATDMIRRTLLPGWNRFERLFDFRQLIEPLIARTAAERRTPEDVERIGVTMASYRDAGTDREASRAADGALHVAIAQATQNPYLANLSGLIRTEISLGFGAEPYSTQIRARAIEHHAELARAVIASNGDAAAATARAHFALTETVLRELVQKINDASPDASPEVSGEGSP
jgi:GntR family transcriptional regulator, transcriptional repressor for pyruvate dehydrogenase complex